MIDSEVSLITHSCQPYNAGPSLYDLRQNFITPRSLFFKRNHGNIPIIDVQNFHLIVDGLVQHSKTYALHELQQKNICTSVTATLSCAGNRRRELEAYRSLGNEVIWDSNAIGTAVWRGVRLRDLLLDAGIPEDRANLHVAFAGLDDIDLGGETFHFGVSIPLQKALMPNVILAFEMNGEPLSYEHGFPLRVIVPGYIGAKSVKWLAQITVQESPSANYYQQQSYKLFPPSITAAEADWNQGVPLQDQVLNSVICDPLPYTQLPAGKNIIKGYAVGSGSHFIQRVEVSADNGKTWQVAIFEQPSKAHRWVFWQALLELPPGQAQLLVRAFDSAGKRQPRKVSEVWNFKGYFNNAWHRVAVTVSP